MASDISIFVDKTKLNIRVGVIIRHANEFIIEVSKIGENSVIPGGRIKIGESSIDALVRETREEMGFEIKKEKAIFKTCIENFFNYHGTDCHELFFLYEYELDDGEYESLKSIGDNKDNEYNCFKFLPKDGFDGYNLLPLQVHDLIRQ